MFKKLLIRVVTRKRENFKTSWRLEMKKLMMVLWVLMVVFAGIGIVYSFQAGETLTGEQVDIKVDTGVYFTIVSEGDVSLKANAPNAFVILGSNYEALVGKFESEKPLGWDYDEYFNLSTVNVPSGTWTVEKGSGISVRIVGADEVWVGPKGSDIAIVFWIVFVFGSLLIWGGCTYIYYHY